MNFKDVADQCTPEQFSQLRQLEERLKLVEAAAKLLDSTSNQANEHAQSPNGTTRTTSTRAKVSSLASELPKVAQLKKKFEMNNRGSRVLTMVSKAFKLGKDVRPPPRPMTLARVTKREGGSGS